MTEFIQLFVSGLAIGAIYGMVALGFVILYKSTDIFNFAQGDLVMVGAYLGYAVLTLTGWPFWAAALVTLVLAGFFGLVLQWLVFKPLIGSPLLIMVMATIALSLILRGLVVLIWGSEAVSYPTTLPNVPLDIAGVRIALIDLIIMAVAALGIIVLAVFFRFTSTGLQLRAIAENQTAAAAVGINANRMFGTAMVIGTVTAAVAGLLLANLNNVSGSLSEIGLIAFPAAVLGGMKSIPGAMVGGLIIGVIGQLAAGYLGGAAATAITFGVLLVVLLVRPQGILGSKEAVRV